MRHDGMTQPTESSMLKEVGTSGQISLGKKYAGQLFDLHFHDDGRVEMLPMKAVPDTPVRGDGWLTPERLAARKAAYARSPEEIARAGAQWELENKDAIEAMNARVAKIGSMACRIHEWRKEKAAQEQNADSATEPQRA